VAIVGSGPSGFYAAEALLKSELHTEVNMFDRLATPYGLVRLGVAPDHAKIKNVIKIYERIAAKDGYAFFGNVHVGRDISIEELHEYHDAIVLAYGAESDRRLNIPGEDLPGSHTATAFVAWYNGHPDFRDASFDLSQETAVVIGQGNVAADVCRILAKTVDELKTTDIAQHALDALAESKIKHIHMIGRRGPVQAKFTQLEVKELGKLDDCDPVVRPEDLAFDPASQAELDSPENKNAPKIVAVLREFAERTPLTKPRKLHLQFKKSPAEIAGNGRVERIMLETNELTGEPFRIKARGSGQIEELPCGLVFRSVGYRGEAMQGVPFDQSSGTVPNQEGRVLSGQTPLQGMYATGWIKRGPTGIIGTNKPDSQATVAALLEDIDTLSPCPKRDNSMLLDELGRRGLRVVSFNDWKSIDAAEISRGEEAGKSREKFTRLTDIFQMLDSP
jgi:ferredoxin--NADP+ reductase